MSTQFDWSRYVNGVGMGPAEEVNKLYDGDSVVDVVITLTQEDGATAQATLKKLPDGAVSLVPLKSVIE